MCLRAAGIVCPFENERPRRLGGGVVLCGLREFYDERSRARAVELITTSTRSRTVFTIGVTLAQAAPDRQWESGDLGDRVADLGVTPIPPDGDGRTLPAQRVDREDVAAPPHDREAPASLGIAVREVGGQARLVGKSDAGVPNERDDTVLADLNVDLDGCRGICMLDRVRKSFADRGDEIRNIVVRDALGARESDDPLPRGSAEIRLRRDAENQIGGCHGAYQDMPAPKKPETSKCGEGRQQLGRRRSKRQGQWRGEG